MINWEDRIEVGDQCMGIEISRKERGFKVCSVIGGLSIRAVHRRFSNLAEGALLMP